MPNLFKRAMSFFGSKTKSLAGALEMASYDPTIIWADQNKISATKAMSVIDGWVYACIRAIAEELANMNIRLYEVGTDGNQTELFNHELLDILHAPNNYQTGYELKYLIGAHLEAVGNAYLYLEGVKNETDIPTAVHILNPSKVKVIINQDSFPYSVQKYKYIDRAKARDFQPYEILHFKYPNSNNAFEGIGTIQSIAPWIDADNYATEFNRRFFINGARVGGFLKSEQALTDGQLDYLRKTFEAIYKGVDNAHKIAVLPKGCEYVAGSETQKDMDFVNLMTAMRDKILAGFRVPKTALGLTEDVNRANAEATNYVFALRTIKPKMELVNTYLNEFLAPRYGENLLLGFDDPVPENKELLIAEMQAALPGQAVISVNEAREQYYGLSPVQNGDSVMMPFSVVPMGKPEPKSINEPKAKSGQKKISRFTRNAKIRKEMSSDIAAKVVKELENFEIKKAEIKNKSITEMTDADWEIVWKGLVQRVSPYEKLQADAIRKFNAKQKDTVIKNLPKAVKSSKAVNTDELFDYEQSVSALVDLSEPIQTSLFKSEAKEALALLGVNDFDPMTPEVMKALKKAIELMSGSYNDTTLQLLQYKLEEGIKNGFSMNELTDSVAQIYEMSDEVRAEQVARTEVFRVANDATKEAWKQSGVVKTIKWYTAQDERVCPYCDPMNGKVIDIEKNFFNKGDMVEGSDGSQFNADYSDVGAPPLHVSCRCYTRPEEITLAGPKNEIKELPKIDDKKDEEELKELNSILDKHAN